MSSSPKVAHTDMEWCNRVLVTSPVYYSLCTSESGFQRGLNKLGISDPPEWLKSQDCGRVHEFVSNHDAISLVVCIRPTTDQKELLATIVHEATHVWQIIRDYIGEATPSREFEAYSVETIFTTLYEAYKQQTKKKKNGAVTKRK